MVTIPVPVRARAFACAVVAAVSLLPGRAATAEQAGAGTRDVVVSAASSLVDVLGVIGAAYESAGGERIVVNAGASNTLARQILAGAPVDVFISADQAQMDVAAPALAAGARITVVRNQLAVAVPARGSHAPASLRDLATPQFRRIAIGDPAAVPAGVYARLVLRRLGLWETLRPRLVPTASVRLALAAVESGAADAAIVYRTDVLTARRARAAFTVPVADGPTISYPAALTRGARNAEGARRFLAFLQSPAAQAIFANAGFLPPQP